MDNYLNQVLGGRYEITEALGMGGMSVVYKAYDRVDDRTVAVKILKSQYMANPEFRSRFKNESMAISLLSHPNIVKVYDVNFGEDLQYIVMEHVEGVTLKEYIDRQRVIPWTEAVHFAVQILRALQQAHDKGIVHRDIKPQNIMLLYNGSIKVTDFGIAYFSRADSKNIAETAAIGSVHYISPEQARGENADGRSDLYAVGVVLYEMVTGKLPFEASDDVHVALMHINDAPQRPSDLMPSIPAGLEMIILRAMQKNPADRYQSAAEFLNDLYALKANPEIKFDYAFFSEKEPTKYIDPLTDGKLPNQTEAPVRITDEEEPPEDDGFTDITDPALREEEEEEAEEPGPRNITIPVLIGIAAALVVVVAIILGVAFSGQMKRRQSGQEGVSESFIEKIDFLHLFSHDKIEVPNFINMDFNEALEKYPELAIENPPQYVYNTTFESGKVCEQFPKAGDRVSKDVVIKLTVANNSEMVLVKDVIGMDYRNAETVLRQLGFKVELIPKPDADAEEGVVTGTEPSVNTYVEYQGTVYVYYAAAPDEKEPISVPNVVGDELEVAKKKIRAAGLSVGSVIYDSSSASLKGYVIGQSPTASVLVNENEYINLTVGNGVPATSTASLEIYLPEGAHGETGELKTYLNNKVNDVYPDVPLDGGSYVVHFTGSGKNNTFKIYVDSSLICSGKIDFAKDPPVISDISTYAFAEKASVPDVVGKTQEEAEAALKAAGFTNIRVESAENDTMPAGRVCAQTPVSSAMTQYQTTTVVTLTVSAGPAATEAPSESETLETLPPEPVSDPTTEPDTESAE